MSSRKRKQQDPPASTRSAKPSRTATSSTAAARCAKSPSAAMAAAASSNYAIRCIRKSKIIEIDEECWTDCNFPDATEELCEDSATAWDGNWLWDSQPNKAACIPYNKACRSFAGGSGKVTVFRSAAEAEAAAAEVWKAMVLATDRPCMPLLEQLQQQQQQRQQAVDASTTSAPKTQQKTQTRAEQVQHASSRARAASRTLALCLHQQLSSYRQYQLMVCQPGR